MDNSLVKLEDFQLEEISGGITAKQVGEYVIKRVCALSGSVVYCVTTMTCVGSVIGWRFKSKGVSVADMHLDGFAKEILSDDMLRMISALGGLAILGSFSIGVHMVGNLANGFVKKLALKINIKCFKACE